MITAVDSSVLIDVVRPDPTFGPGAREALRSSGSAGRLIACDVVWAEVAGRFPSAHEADAAMDQLGLVFDPLDRDAALAAGQVWRDYRRRRGPRERIIADFLIGAHAMRRADRLLTRDRGFFRAYFKGLEILDPTE